MKRLLIALAISVAISTVARIVAEATGQDSPRFSALLIGGFLSGVAFQAICGCEHHK